MNYAEREIKTSPFDYYRRFELLKDGKPTGFWYDYPRDPSAAAVAAYRVAYGATLPDGTDTVIGHIDVPKRIKGPKARARWFGGVLVDRA